MLKTKQIHTEEEMLAFAGNMAAAVQKGVVMFLVGPLGAGKTTFTRGFLRALGYAGKVKSPTFTLVELYELNGRSIFHFDFYRLEKADELEHIGINDYFLRDAICLIEWPEKGLPYLPKADVRCEIAFAGEGRVVKVTAETERGKEIVERI